jgi:hypothetical protein
MRAVAARLGQDLLDQVGARPGLGRQALLGEIDHQAFGAGGNQRCPGVDDDVPGPSLGRRDIAQAKLAAARALDDLFHHAPKRVRGLNPFYSDFYPRCKVRRRRKALPPNQLSG